MTPTDRADARSGQLGEPGGGLGMVMVAMREDGVGDPCAAVGDHAAYPLEVVVVEGTGVDDHRLGGTRLEQDPGVGAVEGHRAGVRGEDAVGPLGDLPTGPQLLAIHA